MSGPLASIAVALRVLPHGKGLPLPAYASSGAAGADLHAALPEQAPVVVLPGERHAIPTGLVFALPTGFEGQIRPRSGLARRYGITVINAPGTIDADYRGEVEIVVINHGQAPFTIRRGERIAQLVIAPVMRASWTIADELDETDRGAAGFGSTGQGQISP